MGVSSGPLHEQDKEADNKSEDNNCLRQHGENDSRSQEIFVLGNGTHCRSSDTHLCIPCPDTSKANRKTCADSLESDTNGGIVKYS